MDIYIGKDGQVLGPYREEEIRARLEAGCFDGTELSCREGLEAWVNVKKLLEEQINKIKELIGLGHADTAWQLIQSLNDPRINEGLLEDCPGNDWSRNDVPEYLSENVDLFIKLLVNPPQSAWLRPELTQFKSLDLFLFYDAGRRGGRF